MVVLVTISAEAQTNYVTATFQNKLGEALMGSCILQDSIGNFIAGQHIADGQFQLETSYTGLARMKFVATAYKTIDTPFTIMPGMNTWGIVQCEEDIKMLQETKIAVTKPVLEKTENGYILNPNESFLGKSISSMELLTRIPMVRVVGDKLDLFGRGEALLLMDGVEITLAQLRSIPPHEIRRIEVLQNPGANYDAKGKAVVLITMKRSYKEGYQIVINQSLQLGMVARRRWNDFIYSSPNITLGLRKGKWNWNMYYGNEYGTNWMENKFTTTTRASGSAYHTDGYYQEDALSKSIHAFRVGTSYAINTKSQLSIQYDGFAHLFNLDVEQHSTYSTPTPSVTQIQMMNDASTTLRNHSMNINYHIQTDTLGSKLFAAIQFNRFTNALYDRIEERTRYPDQSQTVFNRLNDGRNQIELYTGQLDYQTKVKLWETKVGVKQSMATNNGSIHFYSKGAEESEYQENTTRQNAIRYQENITAGYLTLSRTLRKILIRGGLRTEYTRVESFSETKQTTLVDTQYVNLFPSLQVGRKINGDWSVQTSYSKKIGRPIYQDLDPFLWYLDSLTSIQGNPLLKPEFVHQWDASVSYKMIAFRLSHIRTHNIQWAITRNDGISANGTVFRKENIQQRLGFIAAMDISLERKGYSSFTTLALHRYAFQDDRPTFNPSGSDPMGYLYTYHQYRIPKWFTTELTAEYYSPSFDGFTRKNSYYYATLAVSRGFLNDRWNAQIVWNDLLRSARLRGQRTLYTISNTYSQRYSTNYVRITLTYTFKKNKEVAYQNSTINDTEFNRIKK